MRKILIAVINCHGRDDCQDAIRSTWASLVPEGVDVIFFRGRGATREPRADEVYLDCCDTYAGLPEKVRAVILWALEKGYERLVKIDDDVVLFPDELFKAGLENHDFYGNRNSDQGGPPTPWGFLYSLSKKSMEIMAAQSLPKGNNDELWCSKTLSLHGIGLHHEEKCYLQRSRLLAPRKRPLRAPPRIAAIYPDPVPNTFAFCVYIQGFSPEKVEEFMKIWEREKCLREK